MRTPRLLLRRWLPKDREPFAAMNADPAVMHYFPAPLTRPQSDDLVNSIEHHFDTHGFGAFALEELATGEFVGFTGLGIPTFEARFTPCVEIAWRLAAKFHDRGFATEAARRVLQHAFEDMNFSEVVAFTTIENAPSRRVMEKLGMRHDGEFLHPRLPQNHPLAKHVLYRIDHP